MITAISIFNQAINFALDEVDGYGEGMVFLSLWREGAWSEIEQSFPDFDLTWCKQLPPLT